MSVAAPNRVVARLEARGTYRRWVLVVALAGMFATTFPVTILAVSLGDIAREFGVRETVLTWVISAPMLASAVALPLLGKMGDLYGQRRVFLVGFTAATLAALSVAASWNAGSLIGFRTLAQVIGAATQPTSMALVMAVYPPTERVKALGWWSLVSAGGPSVGLVVGGPLIEVFGWRTVFLIQAGLASVVLVAAFVVLREVGERQRVRFDVRGSVALAGFTGGVMVFLNQGTEWGWTHPAVLAGAAIAPVALLAFIRTEARVAAPLLPLDFFRRRNFTAPAVCSFFLGAAYMGGFILAPLLMRFVLGYSLSSTALVMVLRPLTFSMSSPVGGHVATRLGERTTATLGTLIMVGSMVTFAVGAQTRSLLLIASALVFQGLGNGIGRPSLTASLANAVDEGSLGVAAASQRMVHQIGAAFGIAALTAVYGGAGTPSSFARAYVLGVVFAACAAVAANSLRSADRRPLPPQRELELRSSDETPTWSHT